MAILRTPDERFQNLPDYPFEAHYLELPSDVGALRMHYIDEGPSDAPVVLMLHGEPTWSFAWRHVASKVAAAGYRAVAPDYIGFGKSDKLSERSDYSYAGFVDWLAYFVETLDLQHITLACQDWGGPIGLSVLARMPERFDAVVTGNTLLPNCQPPPLGIADWPSQQITDWIALCRDLDDLPVSDIVAGVCVKPLHSDVKAAYDAPFPDKRYKAAVLEFPGLIPVAEGSKGTAENRESWKVLEQWAKPFVTAFSDSDPSTEPWAEVFRARIPGADNELHTVIKNAGHFLQEEQGAALADVLLSVSALSVP